MSVSPILEGRNLVRRAPDRATPLLDHVSLAVGAGERVAVAGPSGAGKTLLLRAVALLDPVDEGTVLWHGEPICRPNIPKFRRSAIYLHQRAALLGDTVETALAVPFTLAIHQQGRFNRDTALGRLRQLRRDELFLGQQAGNLSGGEMQLVALLRALQLEPEVLLLDEPTAALDPETAAAAEQMLVAWVAESPARRALVWVTHDADQAARIATRQIEMADGRTSPISHPRSSGGEGDSRPHRSHET